MEENKQLIVVEQLPVIKQYLEELKGEILEKVKTANALVCTEDTVKEVKKVRTDLTKQFKELEDQRKAVKNAVMTPYNEFEEIYKENVSDLFKEADATLKAKIDSVEDGIKEEKRKELSEYFEEYKNSLNIGFVSFETMDLKVGLSDSMKSLKEKVSQYLDKINDDLMLIDTQEHKEEILVEYRNSLNVANAITIVNNRIKAIEEEKARQEALSVAKEQEQQRIEQVEQVIVETTPVEEKEQVDEPVYTMTFTVRGTKEQLKGVKNYLESEGLEYGN